MGRLMCRALFQQLPREWLAAQDQRDVEAMAPGDLEAEVQVFDDDETAYFTKNTKFNLTT